MKHPNKEIMNRAIDFARKNHKKGGHAVAAIAVKGNKIISEAFTSVSRDNDPTCHAEMNAIRLAAKKLRDRRLSGHYLYTTYEPCPMCTSAAIWARMKGIIYGASRKDRNKKYSWRITSSLYPTTKVVGLLEDGIPDSLCFITRLKSCVFNESKIMIPCSVVVKSATPKLKLYPEFMRKECKELLRL